MSLLGRQSQLPSAFEGRIANPDPDALTVTIDAFDGDEQQRHEWGPCEWMPRGHHVPVRGDRCLVMLSDSRTPWVVAWPGPIPEAQELLATLPAPTWTTPAFSANWVDYGAEDPSYRAGWFRDAMGVVWLRGLVRRSVSTWTVGDVVLTLPPGHRPQQRGMFITFGYAAGVAVRMRVDVDAGGNVLFMDAGAPWGTGGANVIGLDNVRFIAA